MACVEVKISASSIFLFNIHGAPPPAAWKLRLMLELVVNFSVWFVFNIVCGGSRQILMG